MTLLGTKEDYESILTRLDKIEEMGVEAQAFVACIICLVSTTPRDVTTL